MKGKNVNRLGEMRAVRVVHVTRWVADALLVGAIAAAAPMPGAAEEIVIYGFEESLEGWAIPDWAKSSADYVGQECLVSQEAAKEGQSALEVRTDFPGGRWTGAYLEREVEVTDWTPFGSLAVDVYVPPTAPQGLQAKLILTVGDQWTWTEMNRTVPLVPGAWTTISASLKPGSMDWKFFPDDTFRGSVRKVGVRVESDKEPVYRGSVFVDNIRLSES
jgi:hypothetical protein